MPKPFVKMFAVTLLMPLSVAGCLAVVGKRPASPSRVPAVRVVKKGDGYQLLRHGVPFFIKGAGGSGPKPELHRLGANSWRTWGADNLESQLAEAQKLGMAVTVGIWLGHKDNGFDYHNSAQVAAQYADARRDVLRYRHLPALLLWGLGNEMETGQENDPAVWDAIEQIAKMTHQLDPDHPTMTVVAEIGGDKVRQIQEHCPDIDIIGINTYGGAPSIAQRYKDAGGVKPYVVTEFGPPGTWELPKNAWGVVPEPTSTEKAVFYRIAYEKGIAGQPMCLGSYAFTWGNKQEATATWYGLLLPDGSRLAPVDALQKIWTDKGPADPCPVIHRLALDGPDRVAPGASVQATLDATDPNGSPLQVDWTLQSDPALYHTGGGAEASPPFFPEAIVQSGAKGVQVKMPQSGGAYRLYATIHNGHGGAAVGNIPLFVTGDAPLPAPGARKAPLPLVLFGVGAGSDLPYTPSGYMGNTGAIKMDADCPVNPHTGKTCLKVSYTASDNWGGVVWQSPANDWGDKPGGFDLTGAKNLTFWARGEDGGEVVTFEFGLIGKDRTYSDTGKGKLADVVLTKEWKEYSIPLAGQNLTDIKTGFSWTLGAKGKPVIFYLDDIQYQ